MKTACALVIFLSLQTQAAGQVHWHEVETPRAPFIITFGNGHWVGVFDDGRYSSTNGLEWSKRSDNQSTTRPLFVRGEFHYCDTTVAASSNGWSSFRLLGEPAGSGRINTYTFGNDKFYAGRSSGVAFSPDGENWEWSPIADLHLPIRSMAAAHGVTLLITAGNVISSNDDQNWNSLPLNVSFADVKATSSGFLALHYFRTLDGSFATRLHHTYDGVEWRVVQEKPGLADRLFIGPDHVVVWGLDILALVSPDGSEWTDVTRPTKKVIRDLAYGNGRYLGALWPAGFISSAPLIHPQLRSASKTGTTIRLQTESAENYRLEVTDRLGSTWSVLSNVTINAGTFEFQEPHPKTAFFRLRFTAP